MTSVTPAGFTKPDLPPRAKKIVRGPPQFRFFAWIGRNRRLAKDFEATIDSARAFLYAASVMLLVRRIACAS